MFFCRLFAQRASNSQSARFKKQPTKLFQKSPVETEKRFRCTNKKFQWASLQLDATLTATEKLLLQENGLTTEQINHFSRRLFIVYCLEAASKNPSPREEIFKSLLALPPAETESSPAVGLKKST